MTQATTDTAIHPLLTERFSPYRFDANKAVSEADVHALFEAARWTASAFNAQPWRYIVGIKGHPVWEQVLSVLVEGNQIWAKHVPVLALGLVNTRFEHNGKPNSSAIHDLGAASASLTVEATHRGLSVHQMAGIEPDKAISLFDLPEEIQPVTGLAIGYHGSNAALDEGIASRDDFPRVRMPSSDFILRSSLTFGD